MSEYIVSARKYRPMSFDSVVGQQALTTTLKNAVKSGKLAHAYLFCGPRGVGKTTCARIFAKAINCEHPTAEGEACNECESCNAFNEGRSYNIFELDAASNNSVENIKSLMEQTRIPPQVGRYKVFIIDEVHMLSTAAFNAFLKTLEEPPAHVIFILATTEKHKILPTILSRCQIYDFERMTVRDIIGHLKSVAEKENIYGVVNVNCIGNSKQRKASFYTSDNVENPLKTQCDNYFPSVLSDKVTETDAATFKTAGIPTACYYTLDFFTTGKREIGNKYVVEKDSSLVDMDTLIYDTTFITTYASLLKVE